MIFACNYKCFVFTLHTKNKKINLQKKIFKQQQNTKKKQFTKNKKKNIKKPTIVNKKKYVYCEIVFWWFE